MSEFKEGTVIRFFTLGQRINTVMKEVKTVYKDGKISMGGNSYTVVTHDMISALLHEPIANHGIVIYPNVRDFKLEARDYVDQYGKAKREYCASGMVDVVFYNADDREDSFTVSVPGYAFDPNDKAVGKMLSMAVKYAMLKTFVLESTDEEEARPEAKYEQKTIDYKKKDTQIAQIKTELAKKTTGLTTDQKQKFLSDNLKVQSFKDVEKMNNDELVNLFNKLQGTILK